MEKRDQILGGAGPILAEIARQYEEIRTRWLLTCLEEGPGALVFMEESALSTQFDKEADFWELGRLRRFLREEDLLDEFVYRWLEENRERSQIPAVVLKRLRPSDDAESQLSFFTVCRPLGESSKKKER